jgi:parallel beta-helix repeat protein
MMKNYITFLLLLTLPCSSLATLTINPSSATSDYYNVIQEALDTASLNGDTVYISEGIYTISKNLVMGSNTYLRGAGIDKTFIKLQDKAAPWWDVNGKNAGLIRADTVKNIKISDITFDGNKLNQLQDKQSAYGRFGIFMEACDNITYDKVRVQNFQGYGFDPHGFKPTMTWTKGLVITDCIADNNDWDGFTIDQSEDVILRNNVALNNGRHGYNIVTGCRNVLMEGNYAENNGHYYEGIGGGCGIAVQNNLEYGTRNIYISKSVLHDSDRGGFCLNGITNITVSQNTISLAGFCIQALNCVQASITDNTCMTNVTYSINPVTGVEILNNNNVTLPVPLRPTLPSPTPPPEITSPPSPPPPSQTPSSPMPSPPLPPENGASIKHFSFGFVVIMSLLSLTF